MSLRIDSATVLLAVLCIAALLLRLPGIDHGHPQYVSGDERPVIQDAVHFVHDGTLEPQFFNYPTLYSYLFSLALLASHTFGWFLDVGGAGASLNLSEWLEPVRVALVGRLLSALLGVGMVAITCYVGREAYGPGVGLTAGLFVATSSVLVHQSKFALPDTAMAFLATAAIYSMVRALRRGERAALIAASLFTGLAMSAKYNAGMFLVPLAVVLYARAADRARNMLVAAGVLILAFLIGSPHWLFSFSSFFSALLYESSNMQFSLSDRSLPLWHTLVAIATDEALWGSLAIAGCGYAAYSRKPVDLVLLAAVIPAFIYIGSWPKGGLHYLIFLFPPLAVLAARLLVSHLPPRWLTVAVVIIALPSAVGSWRAGIEIGRTDVRLSALHWVEENIPSGTVIGGYWAQYCPPLKSTLEANKLEELKRAHADQSDVVSVLEDVGSRIPFYYGVALDYYLDRPEVPAEYRAHVDLDDPKTRQTFRRAWRSHEEIKRLNVGYVILPEAAYGRFFTGRTPSDFTPEHFYFVRNRDYLKQFFERRDRYRLLREFSPGADLRGSRILIFEVL